MPTTENDRRNQQHIDLPYADLPRAPRFRSPGMRRAYPSTSNTFDLLEESEIPAVEVSQAAGISTRNTEESGEMNEAFFEDGFVMDLFDDVKMSEGE